MNSPLATQTLFHIGPVPVTEPVLATWGIMAILVAGAAWLRSRLALVPSATQAALELVVEAVDSQIRDTMRADPAP